MQLFKIQNLSFLHVGPVNLQVNAAQLIGVSGASGSGKSLLLRALADMDEHQGDVFLDELHQQTEAPHHWRKKVALLPAESRWWFDKVDGHFSNTDDVILLKNLAALGFTKDCLQWSVARLSSGEKQRLGLLRLLQNRPQVLLLDEPTANLDKESTRLFEKLICHYLAENNACAIWVSHDTEQLQRICDQQFVIENGVLNDVD